MRSIKKAFAVQALVSFKNQIVKNLKKETPRFCADCQGEFTVLVKEVDLEVSRVLKLGQLEREIK